MVDKFFFERQKMKKLLCLFLVFNICFVGCAGRNPNPIDTMLPSDSDLTCEALHHQISFCNDEKERLKPKCDKFATNTFWAAAGILLLFPFFFMDVKDAEKIEYDAYNRRAEYLKSLTASCVDTPDGRIIKGYRVENREDGKKYKIPVYDDGSLGKPRLITFK